MGDTCQICGDLIEPPAESVEVAWPVEPYRRMGPYHADCIKDAIRCFVEVTDDAE